MTVLSGSITPQMGGSIRVPIDNIRTLQRRIKKWRMNATGYEEKMSELMF